MAKINYDYCEEKVLYDSGTIENTLLEIYKSGKKATIQDNPNFFYTVTDIRENIINWYPFKKDSTILEVGGGLGSITGHLCKAAKKVVSNEYSKRRAENIFYRHQECDNLEVVVGNIEKIEFEEKFDYIVLIGVFEYSKRFFSHEKPFHYFLEILKRLLKEDGVILIAIENRYGMKYFAGSNEDHYPEKYLSLYGYDNKDIQTFGKQELTNIINESGFKYQKFYYPYPDYKMPYLIYTDERLPKFTEIKHLYLYNHGEQFYNFDYRKIIPGLIQNNQYGFFANSFLVEITNKKENISDINYVKTFLFRKRNCQVNTIFSKDNEICKIPKFEETEKHLENMIKTNEKLTKLGLNVANITKKEKKYFIEFISGDTLTECIKKLADTGNVQEIKNEIEAYYNILKKISIKSQIKKYCIEEEKEYFGNQKIDILKLGLYDFHTSNIIKNEKGYFVIDQEWITNRDIPLKYMLYFSIRFLFEWIENLKNILNEQEIYQLYEISEEEIDIYNKMSLYLSNEANNIDNDVMKIIFKENEYKDIDCKIDKYEQEINNINKNYEQEINNIKSNYEQEISNLNDNKEQLSSEIELLKEKIIKEKDKTEELSLQIEKIIQDKNEIEKLNDELNINFETLNQEYSKIISSKSWKLTKILRKINSILIARGKNDGKSSKKTRKK